jgi:small subunit ribosomal protein S6
VSVQEESHLREYETTIIVQPEISDDGAAAIFERLEAVLTENDSIRLLNESLGKRKLAYEIRKFHKGHYYILSYLSDGKVVAPLERALRLNESILRFMTIQTEADVTDIEARKVTAAEAEAEQSRKAAERAAREEEEAKARADEEAKARAEAEVAAADRAAEAAANPVAVEAVAEGAEAAAPVETPVAEAPAAAAPATEAPAAAPAAPAADATAADATAAPDKEEVKS